jgi:hypothetical protein
MTAQPLIEPLIAAGLTVAMRTDQRLVVTPSWRITPALDAHIRAHRDELIAALSAVPVKPLPPAPPWLAAWMEQDDARRAATMAAGKRRLAARR